MTSRLFATGAFSMLALLSAAIPFAAVARSALAQPPPGADLVLDDKVVGRRVAPVSGDICVVCNRPVGAQDIAYLVEGRRVAVHSIGCDGRLRAKPRLFLAQLKPRGAFLGAEQGQAAQLSLVWFWAGAYVLVGLLFAALCAHRALQSGYNPFAWFAAGFLLNILAYLALLTRPRREIAAPGGVPAGLGKIHATREPEPCPHCGAMNHPAASQCLGCGASLTPHAVSEAREAGLRVS